MILAIVSLTGMVVMSGCEKDTDKDLKKTGKYKGHAYVDLALPSGTKWATCNIGAEKPEESGEYFAWGRITAVSYHGEDNYTYQDNPAVLPADNDVATTKWGKGWRMPTEAEIRELIDNCTWDLTSINGVDGCKVTGSNGNCIFLPGAGLHAMNYSATPSTGYYWSSSRGSGEVYYDGCACSLQFGPVDIPQINFSDRPVGLSVRAVHK